MNNYHNSQYDGHSVASASQNHDIDPAFDQLDPANLANSRQPSRQISGYVRSTRQESVARDVHMNNVHEQYEMMNPQIPPMNFDQSGMMRFGSSGLDAQFQFSPPDLHSYEFVPSDVMNSSGMPQDLRMAPDADLFGHVNSQSMIPPQDINMHQSRRSIHEFAPLSRHMSYQNNSYNMASSELSIPSPMIHDFSQDVPVDSQYMQQNAPMGCASRSVSITKNSMHNIPLGLSINPQIHAMQIPMSIKQQGFPHQQWTNHSTSDRLQSPPRQGAQINQNQQHDPPPRPNVKQEDRRHSMPPNPQNFDPSQLRLLQSRRGYDKGRQHVQFPSVHYPQSNQATFNPSASVTRPMQACGSNYPNAYSSSGFDMMAVLMRVATRRNPQINLGAVDLSCAFTVCDTSRYDVPIVYCSENFEQMTGYSKQDILGRNCRFLQAPDGNVQAGVKRQYVDDDTVLRLKNMITKREEVQVSLINYRKGGQPFMNLLTLIPIPWDSDEIKYYVGFQVDLVEQPHSVHSRNQDGSYQVNYQRGVHVPRYIAEPNNASQYQRESGQTISRDDISIVMTTIALGGTDLSERIWDKALLENTDDVVFVLSLKGLFLYMSPSSTRILEYEPGELLGTPLSSVAHPSDIVPVTRELKEASASASIDIVFRFRRKVSGYMWFEGYGCLHTDQTKGRKSVVLVGRERPVYTLSKDVLLSAGGLGENEIWSKLSTSGMFLFVAGNARQLLDRLPSELLGTSIQAIMSPDSHTDFGRVLDIANTGKRAQCKHDILSKRGQVLQAFSTLYSGDATDDSRPTFVIAQTRILKYTRLSGSSYRSQTHTQKLERQSPDQCTSSRAASIDTSNARSLVRKSGSAFDSASPHQTLSSRSPGSPMHYMSTFESSVTSSGRVRPRLDDQNIVNTAEANLFEELKPTRSTSWQFELRQMEKSNRVLAEKMQNLLAARKKRKRRQSGAPERDCSNCHVTSTPEWRRGPSGARDLCNSCGLRWAKQQGRISPRTAKSNASGVSGSVAGSVAGSASPVSTVDSQVPRQVGAVTEQLNATTAEAASSGHNTAMQDTSAEHSQRRSADTASASRRSSASGSNDTGAHKVAKTEGASGPHLPLEQGGDAVMGEVDEDTDTESEDSDEEPQLLFRHSGHPNAGTVLDGSIVENFEGEREAEEDMDVGD